MEPSDIKSIAQKVISSDSLALQTLGANFPDGFARAIKYIAEDLKGDIIVTGMGKGGYVAHRLAATLSSTGRRAIYMHPAEASHGDMGMITEDDCVLMISNSGESTELFNIIDYCKRFGIKIIAICSNDESTIGKAADFRVTIPAVEEDCIIGKAPTSSIILISSISNAFVVALEHTTGLTSDKYHNWHPHGALGRSLIKVSDIMHGEDEIPVLPLSATTDEILEVMSRPVRFGCVGALDHTGRLCGIITDGDFRRKLKNHETFMDKTMSALMNPSPSSVLFDALATEATRIMNDKRIQTMFVVDAERKPVGIISFHDLMKAGLV